MGFGKYSNKNAADLLHRIDLSDLETGDPAMIGERRQFFIIRGAKSRAWQAAIEMEAAKNKKKGKGADDFTFAENARVLARRLSGIVVAAYVDVGYEEPDVIEFDSLDELPSADRNKLVGRLRESFAEITDLAMVVHDEAVRDVNFLPDRGQALSALLSSRPTTEQPQTAETAPA